MATLREHQAAMVDLLASGSGIPASASRLAHAMHDLIAAHLAVGDITFEFVTNPLTGQITKREVATTPGLNDKALSKPQKALKTDSPAKWPTPAERRITELENTIRQLKANNAKLKKDIQDLRGSKMLTVGDLFGSEQAGCRKDDTQTRETEWVSWSGGKCPLPADTIVEVKFYDRQTESGSKASAYVWRHGTLGVRELDIIAYRVIPE